MTHGELFYRFGVALAIGMLIGLERERAHDDPKHRLFAGVRTFSLIGIVGCLTAFLADTLSSPLPFIAVLLALGTWVAVAYSSSARRGEVGITTEMAVLVVFLSGALCYHGHLALSVAVAVATTALLSLKPQIHQFARAISREDIYATLQFAVVTAIVLPVLPNQPLGPPPFDGVNPYRLWLMVVLISGISFLGYVLIKLVGPRMGIGLTGLLGGLASSTAVTISLTERSKGHAELGRPLALAIMIAWTVMFARVVAIVGMLNVALLRALWGPMVAASVAGLAYCAYLYLAQRTADREDIAFSNPFHLGPALQFGLLYGVVLLASRAAQMWLGNAGVYLSSILAGLAGVDAVALAMADLARVAGGPDVHTAMQAIVLAAMSNTVAKGVVVMAGGSPALRRALLPGLQLILAVGVGVVILW